MFLGTLLLLAKVAKKVGRYLFKVFMWPNISLYPLIFIIVDCSFKDHKSVDKNAFLETAQEMKALKQEHQSISVQYLFEKQSNIYLSSCPFSAMCPLAQCHKNRSIIERQRSQDPGIALGFTKTPKSYVKLLKNCVQITKLCVTKKLA